MQWRTVATGVLCVAPLALVGCQAVPQPGTPATPVASAAPADPPAPQTAEEAYEAAADAVMTATQVSHDALSTGDASQLDEYFAGEALSSITAQVEDAVAEGLVYDGDIAVSIVDHEVQTLEGDARNGAGADVAFGQVYLDMCWDVSAVTAIGPDGTDMMADSPDVRPVSQTLYWDDAEQSWFVFEARTEGVECPV